MATTTAEGRGGIEAPRRSGTMAGLARVFAPLRQAQGVSRWVVWTGVAITVLFLVMAVAAPLVAPFGFDEYQTAGERFPKQGAPSSEHLFGTTVQSTDVLSRVVYGARTAMSVVVLAVVFSLSIGLPLGLFSGYFGGKLDRLLVLLMDALYSFPHLLMAIVIAFLLSDSIGKGVVSAAIAISVIYIPQYFRVVRNHVISVREEPYVEAARALGARPRTVIGRYVFFNVIQNVPVIGTLNAADAILTLAGLGFLGYGIQPTEAAEWGYDLQRAIADVGSDIWWTGLFPGLAIVLLVTGLTLLGEGLNDVINPVLRRRPIRPVRLPERTERFGPPSRQQEELPQRGAEVAAIGSRRDRAEETGAAQPGRGRGRSGPA
ncbi:MAG: ABC transporter permease [Actinomycetota bacterium]